MLYIKNQFFPNMDYHQDYKNFENICDKYPDAINRYRLHKGELVALLQRAGMFDLPDLRYDAVPEWDVPRGIESLEE